MDTHTCRGLTPETEHDTDVCCRHGRSLHDFSLSTLIIPISSKSGHLFTFNPTCMLLNQPSPTLRWRYQLAGEHLAAKKPEQRLKGESSYHICHNKDIIRWWYVQAMPFLDCCGVSLLPRGQKSCFAALIKAKHFQVTIPQSPTGHVYCITDYNWLNVKFNQF